VSRETSLTRRLAAPFGVLREMLDRATYRADGLTGTKIAERIELPGATPTVLALHGYCGVPAEVELACEAAQDAGLATVAPLLAGHGMCAKELAPLRFDDWVRGAEQELAAVSQRGPVVLTGLSLGSLVTLELALRYPERVRGLVLIANALWLTRPFPSLALRAIGALGLPDFAFPKLGSDIADPEARRTQTSYMAQPVHGAIDLQRAGDRLQGQLGRIQCPVLLLHGARDRVCPVENSWKAAELLGSQDVQVRVFPHSHHILTRDVEKAHVREAMATFFRRLAQ
jgi:carboxylesterase